MADGHQESLFDPFPLSLLSFLLFSLFLLSSSFGFRDPFPVGARVKRKMPFVGQQYRQELTRARLVGEALGAISEGSSERYTVERRHPLNRNYPPKPVAKKHSTKPTEPCSCWCAIGSRSRGEDFSPPSIAYYL